MKQKITIVYRDLGNFHATWLYPWFEQWFNFEEFVEGKTYDPVSCIFYFGYFHIQNTHWDWCTASGYRMLYDNLSEIHAGPKDSHVLVAHSKNWFWYNESLWYRQLAYSLYRPRKTYQNLALMPMRRKRTHRTELKQALESYLHRFLWSYTDFGKQLPDDRDIAIWNTQRFFNPMWYDSTYFSVVAETFTAPGRYQPVFVTEKIMKPMAFYHPYIVYGQPNTLAYMRSQGFETFENLFDESYDLEQNDQLRLNKIVENIAQFVEQPYDTLTKEKLKHNRDRFFDQNLVKQKLYQDVVEPILEFMSA